MKSPPKQVPDPVRARPDRGVHRRERAARRSAPWARRARRPRSKSSTQTQFAVRSTQQLPTANCELHVTSRPCPPLTALRPDWPLAIAQVTPYPWERAARGQRVRRVAFPRSSRSAATASLVIAASGSRAQVRESRRLIRAAASRPGSLFAPGEVRVLAPMQTIATPARRGGRVSLPLDATRTIEHAARARPARHRARARALRAQRVRCRAAPLARAQRGHLPLAHRARALDAGRAPVHRAVLRPPRRAARDLRRDARALISSFFPGDYDVVPPGRRPRALRARGAGARRRPHRVRRDRGAGGAAALPARAAARCRSSARGARPSGRRDRPTRPPRLAGVLRERVRFAAAAGVARVAALPARTCCARRPRASRRRAMLVLKAIAAGAVPLAVAPPRVRGDAGRRRPRPAVRAGRRRGPDRAARAPRVGRRAARAAARRCERHRSQLGWDRVADTVEDVYRRVIARRHPRRGQARRAAAAREPRLHLLRPAHAHGPLAGLRDPGRRCCSTPPSAAGWARSRSPTTTRSRARTRRAARADGIKVIVAEEVKTAHEGEVIGLFIEEKIPRGMSLRGDDRRDPRAGRPRVRAAPVRPAALGARLRAPAEGGRGHRRRSRSSTRG